MTTMRMIVDDCVRKDSLTVFSGFINRIADKLQQLTVKSQGVYFLSRVSTLTRDIDIAILSVRLSVRPSVRPKRPGIG